jgi:hypothetical protein
VTEYHGSERPIGTTEECECAICHELFMAQPGENICDRCCREMAINEDET